ncbi:MAG: hypothetical protein ACRDJF_10585, partial [Actinomycetota bacterium]
MQRVVSPMGLTAPTDAFQKDLAAQRPPRPFLAPLGHVISAHAPSGIVRGLITTLPQRTRAWEGLPPPAPKAKSRQSLIQWSRRPAWVQRFVPGAGDAPLEDPSPGLEMVTEEQAVPISGSVEPDLAFETPAYRELPSAPALPEGGRSLVTASSSVIEPLRLPALPAQRVSEDVRPSRPS